MRGAPSPRPRREDDALSDQLKLCSREQRPPLSLEIGSASMNLFCLYPHRRDCLRTYAVVMTASNLLGAYCFLGWAACAEMLPTRTLGGGQGDGSAAEASRNLLLASAAATSLAADPDQRSRTQEKTNAGRTRHAWISQRRCRRRVVEALAAASHTSPSSASRWALMIAIETGVRFSGSSGE